MFKILFITYIFYIFIILGFTSNYHTGLIDELVMRFEKPNPSQRWDNPCFVVTVEKTNSEDIVCQVADHLFSVGTFIS